MLRSWLEKAGLIGFPVTALLLVGLLALPHLDARSTRLFLVILIVSIGGVILGELALLFLVQRQRQRRYQALIDACQDALIGHEDIRPHMQGDPCLLPLARQLNLLLDTILLAHKHSQQQQAAIVRHQQEQAELRTQLHYGQSALAQLSTQVQHLLRTLSPVLQGDLRVRADLPAGEVGRLADVCNALIEETVKQVRWTRTSSQQFSAQTRQLLTSVIALAGQVEGQLQHFSQTTEATEQMAASLSHVNQTLHLSLDSMGQLQQRLHPPLTLEQRDVLGHLEQTMRYHLHLLTDLTQTTREQAVLAEALIAQCVTSAQRLHQSSVGLLQTAEHLTTVAWLAEQRAEEVRTFQLPDSPSSVASPQVVSGKRQVASPPPSVERGAEQYQAHVV